MKKNKVGKYFKYAIGEIFLVVIGILIALFINNKNQDFQIEKRTTILLKEIVKDLEMFITLSNKQLEFYSKKQRIFDLILNDKLTYDDYSKPTYPNLFDATTWYTGGGKRHVAYINLTTEINSIPDKYKSILGVLNGFYNSKFNEEYSKLIENISIENQKNRANNYEWYSSMVPDNKNDGKIDFMLNDFKYKNEVKYYNNIVHHHIGFILRDKIGVQKIIKKIKKVLRNSDKENNSDNDSKINNTVIGEWKSIDYPNFKINIINNNNKLIYNTSDDSTKFELNAISNSIFIDNDKMFWTIEKKQVDIKLRIINLEFEKLKK
jgi:hypothetical protein